MTIPRISAVILDMDGLMLDTEAIYKRAWQRAAHDLGFALDNPTYNALIGRSNEEGEAELARMFGATFAIADFRERWSAAWRAVVERDGIPIKSGLHRFLDGVASFRLPVAVATSSDREYTAISLGQAGLAGHFRIIVTGDQVARAKPAPDLYLEAALRLGVSPGACLALEDSDHGVIAAHRAGTIPLLIPDIKTPSPEALRAAYRVLRSLDEAAELLPALVAPAN